MIPWWRTDFRLAEVEGVSRAIKSQWITQGRLTQELEERLSAIFKKQNLLLANNGSAALLAALIACGVGKNDEVIIPDLTFIATAQAPLLLGAKVRLVDVLAARPLIDVTKIEAQITPRTKAIIAVHLNGRAAAMEQINGLAQRYKIKVIEDAAQALFSRNPSGMLGAQSDVGIFSLGITKLLTTGEGGLLIVRDKSMFARLKQLRDKRVCFDGRRRLKGPPINFNFKFNDIMAAIGLAQLKGLKKRISVHNEIYRFYEKELSSLGYIKMLEVDQEKGELPLWVEALCLQRDKLICLLKDKGIEAKPFDPALSDLLGCKDGNSFKCSRRYAKYGLILPSGPGQSKKDLGYTIKVLRDIGRKVGLLSPKQHGFNLEVVQQQE
jgi:dTDP-4-amino-4,6-dideoxygalactose transaminase